jgi:hypothetical protein
MGSGGVRGAEIDCLEERMRWFRDLNKKINRLLDTWQKAGVAVLDAAQYQKAATRIALKDYRKNTGKPN